jgi:SAM-dependent methyltransferase
MADVTARFQSSIPEIYDRHLGPVIFEPYAAELARRVNIEAPASLLEIACGTGILTAQLRARLPPGVQIVATDLNPPMIDHARSRMKMKDADRIEWRTADAAALPFPDRTFACAVCQFGLMFVPDKDAAFREARRVLVDRGLFAFNVWDGFANNSFGRIAHETIGSFFGSDPPTFYQVPFGFNDLARLRRLLATNGFIDITLDHVALEVRSASARSFALGLVKGNPVNFPIAERGVDEKAIIDAVAAALTKVGGDNPFRVPTQAVVATARAGVR